MISDEVKDRLRDSGARSLEICSIERLVDVSSVFCFAKPHADRFHTVVLQGTPREAAECMKAVIDGLRGWVGDTAKEHKAEARRWIKRVAK